MRRALILESGRFRAYVSEGQAHLSLPHDELQIKEASDAKDLADITAAIHAEISGPGNGISGFNPEALRQMLAAQQQHGFGGALQGVLSRLGNPYGALWSR